jgi:thiosulfate dehydrogenase (quinone) large subunit
MTIATPPIFERVADRVLERVGRRPVAPPEARMIPRAERAATQATMAARVMPIAVCLMQIAVAYEWLVSGINKVASPYFATGLKVVLQQHVYNDELHTPYSAFLQRLIIPNAEGYAHLITWAEVMVGVVLLGSAILWLARPSARVTVYAACAACIYLVAAIVMNLNYYLVDDEAAAWINPLHAFNEGVQLDAMLLLFSLVLLGANVAALRTLSRRAED